MTIEPCFLNLTTKYLIIKFWFKSKRYYKS